MPGISFIIVTGGTNDEMVNQVIDSIEAENMPEYEVILVGGESTTVTRKNTSHIPFDETLWTHIMVHGKPGKWTTRKKNLGIQAAKYDLVIPMHDYIKILPGWYEELLKFGFDWDICNHQCLLFNGARGDGWRLLSWPGLPYALMIPYDIDCFVKHMILQGNYWIAKKDIMLKYPISEKILWGMEDDAEWSRRVVPNCNIKMNPNCIYQYLKPRPDDANHIKDMEQMESYNHLWDAIRQGQVKNYVLHRERYVNDNEVEIP